MPKNKKYDNTNKGTLFRNYDKENMAKEKDTSKWANAQGKLDVFGMEFYISSWTNVIKNGEHEGDRMQSLTIKPVDEDQGRKLEQAIKNIIGGSSPKKGKVELDEEFDDMDDDLPF